MLTRKDKRKILKKIATRKGAEQFFDNIVANFYINIEILDFVIDYVQYQDLFAYNTFLRDDALTMMNQFAQRMQTATDDKSR